MKKIVRDNEKHICVYCGFMECKKAILAVINPTYVVVEIRPEKNSGPYGI